MHKSHCVTFLSFFLVIKKLKKQSYSIKVYICTRMQCTKICNILLFVQDSEIYGDGYYQATSLSHRKQR